MYNTLQPSIGITSYLSTIDCRWGIQDAARWQFCKKTQRPFSSCAFATSSSALFPWPRPSDIMSMCSVLPLSCFAKRINDDDGLDPEQRETTEIFSDGTMVQTIYYLTLWYLLCSATIVFHPAFISTLLWYAYGTCSRLYRHIQSHKQLSNKASSCVNKLPRSILAKPVMLLYNSQTERCRNE